MNSDIMDGEGRISAVADQVIDSADREKKL